MSDHEAPYIAAPGVRIVSWGVNELDLLTGEQVTRHHNLAVQRLKEGSGQVVASPEPMSNSKRIAAYLAQTGRQPARGEPAVTALTPAQRRRIIKKTRRLALRGRS